MSQVHKNREYMTETANNPEKICSWTLQDCLTWFELDSFIIYFVIGHGLPTYCSSKDKYRFKCNSAVEKPLLTTTTKQNHGTSAVQCLSNFVRNPLFKSKAHAFHSHRLHQVLEDVVVLDGVASATVQYSANRSDCMYWNKVRNWTDVYSLTLQLYYFCYAKMGT